jgi:rRNA maturation RNase YbeY
MAGSAGGARERMDGASRPRYERPMPAAVVSRRRRVGVRAAQVRRDALQLLRLLKVDAELSVALVGDEEMQALNARYRKKDRPTDVLSFGATKSGAVAAGPFDGAQDRLVPAGAEVRSGHKGRGYIEAPLLGDVVISVDTAARQADTRGVSIDEELRFLLAHGVLHLLGYDHERSPADARRMFAKQRRLITALETGSGCRVSGVGSKPRRKI